jgi:hypothetical protein
MGGGSRGMVAVQEPLSIPRDLKSIRQAASLSSRWLVSSICPRASKWLERRQGSLTAFMCLDSVIDEHSRWVRHTAAQVCGSV